MFGRFAAVLILGTFAAAIVAHSAVTKPALPEVSASEPAIQLAQLRAFPACKECRLRCRRESIICLKITHNQGAECNRRYRICLGLCRTECRQPGT